MSKPFSQACENNKEAILQVLQKQLAAEHLGSKAKLLEIGTGTGQHAVYFARKFPELFWQTSDLIYNHEGINLWIDEAEQNKIRNIGRPVELDVTVSEHGEKYQAVFSANTLHIMSAESVIHFFNLILIY